MNTFIELLKAALLGIIEGITEWLPVSSTGHMLLVDEFLQMAGSETFVKTFMVVIQLGAILAVVVIYFKRLWPFDFRKQTKKQRKNIWMLWFKILVACIPAGVIGVLFDDKIDELFFNPTTIAICLIVYGIGFLIVESLNIRIITRTVDDIDFITAANIGLFQLLALIPGTSRSGATILGGRILGVSRTAVCEFTFFMAIPVMAGASLLKLLKCGFAFTGLEWALMGTGFIVAFIVSMFVIRLFMNYIRNHDFRWFGVYRIILGALVLVYFYVLKK